MRESIPATLMVLFGVALVAGHPHAAPAQDKAQITDIFKERPAVDDPKVVAVRQYDVPPGWATPMHQHTGAHVPVHRRGFWSDGDGRPGTGRRGGASDPSASRQTDDHEEFQYLSAAEVPLVSGWARGAAADRTGGVIAAAKCP